MPFSLFNPQPAHYDFMGAPPQDQSGYSGLSLEDLWRPEVQAQYPEEPQPLGSVRDLDEERRKAIRRNAILQAAMAFGQGANNPGQLGTALSRAAMESGQFRDQTVADANSAQMTQYQRERQMAEQRAQAERQGMDSENQKRRAEAMVGLVRQIATEDPDLAPQAELAARSGDEKRLQELLGDVRRRAQMRQYGMDPDDPFAEDRMKGVMKTEEEIQREQRLKELGLDSYFQEPEESAEAAAARAGAIAEAQARAYARHRAPAGGAADPLKPRWMEADGGWGLGKLDKNGNPVFVRADGLPPEPPKWVFNAGDGALPPPFNLPYRINVATGEVVPVPIKSDAPPSPVKNEGEDAPPPKKNDPPKKDPARQRIEAQARIVERSLGGGFTPEERKAVEQALAQGQAPGQVVAKIKKLRGG